MKLYSQHLQETDLSDYPAWMQAEIEQFANDYPDVKRLYIQYDEEMPIPTISAYIGGHIDYVTRSVIRPKLVFHHGSMLLSEPTVLAEQSPVQTALQTWMEKPLDPVCSTCDTLDDGKTCPDCGTVVGGYQEEEIEL